MRKKLKIGVYAGSFDPFTSGHLDVLRDALELFDRVIVLVAINPRKQTLFTLEERVEMIREVLKDLEIENAEVDSWEGATVDYARIHNATFLIRGLRTVSDFEAELTHANANERVEPPCKTIFIPATKESALISSTVVRDAALVGKIIRGAVHPAIERRLREKLGF